jgi:hypothetical protein
MGLIHPVGVAEHRPTNLMLKHVEIRKKNHEHDFSHEKSAMIWGTLIILLVLKKSIGYPLQYPMKYPAKSSMKYSITSCTPK